MGRVTIHRQRFKRAIMSDLTKTMRAVGLEGERVAKTDVLNQPGQGEPYVRSTGGVKRRGIASAPGDPPAPDTSALRGRTSSEAIVERDAVIGRTSVLSDYAELLDQGTEKMAPRPFKDRIRNKMVRAFHRIKRRFLPVS